MTSISGVHIVIAPCCGARYVLPCYVSLNFMASEYWTDDWREDSLMPNDEGLRQCECGRFVLIRDLLTIGTAETSELPPIPFVPDERLPECIAQAQSEAMEVAARLEYWRYLNHPYRQQYRQHRDAEEAATKAAWEAANPDRRTWWQRLLRRKAPSYRRPPDSPFTFPAFEPTAEQRQNMERLSEILLARSAAAGRGFDALTLAELYRELGRFDEAERAISTLDGQDGTASLIARLIKERRTAPTRYRF